MPLIATITIGGGSADAATRFTGYGIASKGWQPFVAKNIAPVVEWFKRNGLRPRFELRNPFGLGAGGAMQFDQAIHASIATPQLAFDYVTAWKPIIDAGAEVIAYLGRFASCPMDRVMDAMAVPLAAGCSIGFDSAGVIPQGTPAEMVLRSLGGFRKYVEPRPFRNWSDCNVISHNGYFTRSDPDKFTDTDKRMARNRELTGEVCRGIWVERSKQTRANIIDTANAIIDAGHTPMVEMVGSPVDAQTTKWIDAIRVEGGKLVAV